MSQRRMYGLRMTVLETFLAVADHADYKAAAKALGCDKSTVWRHIDELHSWLGANPIDCYTPLQLSDAGTRFRPVAQEVVELLTKSRLPYRVDRIMVPREQKPSP